MPIQTRRSRPTRARGNCRLPETAAVMASTALFAALAGVGCSGGASASRASTSVEKSALARNTAPNVPSAEQSALEAANESFAFQVYGALGAAPSANLVLSPYSLSSALGMTYAGARTATADQMAQTLDFIQLDPSTATSQAEVPPAFDWLDLQLASRAGGAVGDAANATAEKGEASAEHAANAFIDLLRDVHAFDVARLHEGPLA